MTEPTRPPIDLLTDAGRASSDELARLSLLCARIGQHCRAEITRQAFTPPPAADQLQALRDESEQTR